MARLLNNKHELFAQYCLKYKKSESYLKAGFTCKKEYAPQNAYALCKNHPEVEERIKELEKMARSDAKNEIDSYICFLDDVVFARGEFSGENKPKLEQRLSASTKAMKAQGFEGSTDVNVSGGGGFQIVMHSKPEEEKKEEEKEGDKEDGKSED